MPIELKPIVKWPGGKTSEAKKIIPLIPNYGGRFIDPFVGGGAILFDSRAKRGAINDLSVELIELYSYVKRGDKEFFETIHHLNDIRCSLTQRVIEDRSFLLELFNNFLRERISRKDLSIIVEQWVENNEEKFSELTYSYLEKAVFYEEIRKNLIRKILRMEKLSTDNGGIIEKDIIDNMNTVMHSSFYMYIRHLYNYAEELFLPSALRIATFFYIREFCYSSMFRFNQDHKFNVPYGGMAYNSKNFYSKIERLQLPQYQEYLRNIDIYNKDFEDFFNVISPDEEDFVFFDPPYDSDFSTYDQNQFSKDDHRRLAKFMENTQSRFLMVIKNSVFVMDLYGSISGVYIEAFDKKYSVSFQNRNDKQAKHLIITNYALPKLF